MDTSVFVPAPGEVPPEAAAEFDALLDTIDPRVTGSHSQQSVDLTARTTRPIWQFLMHAATTGRFALHGSATHELDELEARQSNDVGEFGNRCGVYAACDGLWPFYFAIVDRTKVHSLVNAAFTTVDSRGVSGGPWYYFSVDSDDEAPWRDGTLHLLPIDGFEREADRIVDGLTVRSAHLFHDGPVRPVAKVRVRPDEFPLLEAITRHDRAEVTRRAAEDPDGFPWA